MEATPLDRLPTPALLVDRARLAANIEAGAEAARAAGVALRPHFKTSKSLAVARAQLAAGAVGFTCATPAEVEALLDAGMPGVLWAHQPVGPWKVAFGVRAARGGATLAVDSAAVGRSLHEAASRAGVRVPVLIEVDTGLGRSGVPPSTVVGLAAELSTLDSLELRGVFTHEGHVSKHLGDRGALEATGRAAGEALVGAAGALRSAGYRCDVVSVGSTPGLSSTPTVPGVTETRAGTYVFHDANQVALGTVSRDRCALTVLARVVTARHDGMAIVDAGTKAMSSDPAVDGSGLGRPVLDGLEFRAANEEHGFVSGPAAARLRVGDLVRIVPNHACATVNMWSAWYLVDGDTAVDEQPTVARH
jgi:D-serine deaminase-like pyridoxal phosphate-dependent protein